ncbi:MAG: glycerophosphodiester phosphodiesterase family protein [Crocosphaera sp.]|nr:glycerophosphodiester phosphodiesterase family protein [Crocosphaera sp.]
MSNIKVTKMPLVIAHRGASAFRPEHTLEAYELAIDLGADFIEPDLVVTRDRVLVARHENELSGTTNVAEIDQFTDRKTAKMIDGNLVTGWFAEDFTLAELKTLRVKERIPNIRPNNRQFDGLFEIPTFREIIALVKQKSKQIGRKIGIYPETKHPTFLAKEGKFFTGNEHENLINICLGELLINTLIEEDFTDPDHILIQSFEFENLIELKTIIMPNAGVDIPLIQLYGSTVLPTQNSFQRPYDIVYNTQNAADMSAIYGHLVNTCQRSLLDSLTGYGHLDNLDTLQYISNTYADGIGVWKNSILPRISIPLRDKNSKITTKLTGEVTSFVDNAHQAGLWVHCYTLRPEEVFLSLTPDGIVKTMIEEIEQLMNIGVDGFFCDSPATCRQVVDTI